MQAKWPVALDTFDIDDFVAVENADVAAFANMGYQIAKHRTHGRDMSCRCKRAQAQIQKTRADCKLVASEVAADEPSALELAYDPVYGLPR